MAKLWYSENQRKWLEYVNGMPSFMSDQPSPNKGSCYAVIDGVLLKYTEMYSGDDPDYAPNYDDAEFLGHGEFVCHDWNLQTYLRKHPEVRLADNDNEWPEFIG